MARTIQDIFGVDVTLDETTATDPKLVIRLQNFQDNGTGAGEITDGNGIDDVSVITSANLDTFSSDILVAIIKMHIQKQPTTNTDETDATYVDFDSNRNKSFVTRNSVTQLRFNPTVNIYQPDTTTTFDPDQLV